MSDEAELIRDASAGDRGAFDRLIEPYRARVGAFITLMVGEEADVEDLIQETLTAALRSIRNFRGDSRFSSWLLGVALNVCRHWRRRKKRASIDPDELAKMASDRMGTVLSSIIRKETAERIALHIARLPNVLREAFVLRYVENLDYEEVAQVAETTVGAARVRAHRARVLLQAELGKSFETLFRRSQR